MDTKVVLENVGVKCLLVLIVHAAALSVNDLPAGQGRQKVASVAPFLPLNVPTGHGVNPPSQVPIFCAEQ